MTSPERSRSIRTLGLLALALCSAAPPAHADEPRVTAEALFREGRSLLARGEIDAACDKLAKSQELDASGGTLMNLADCREKQGKTATAWKHFVAAEGLSQKELRVARANEAKRRAALLLPRLSTLTIVAGHALPGLEVRRDGDTLATDQLGVATPLDPGQHQVSASAPGYEPISINVTLGSERDAQTVTLPELKPVATAEPPASPASPPVKEPAPVVASPPLALEQPLPTPAAERTDTTTLGYIAGGTGAAFASAGAVFYFLSLSANDEAKKGCPVKDRFYCDTKAIEAESRRDTYATIATIGGVAGIAGLGLGAWLVLTSPHEPGPGKSASKRTPQLAPVLSAQGARLFVRGEF